MGVIELKGMEFHAFIGHYDEEKQIGNNFKVDVKMWYDHKAASKSDDLSDALDYQLAYNLIKEEMLKKCNLIENVGRRLLIRLHESFPQMYKAQVKVRKLFPKLGGIVEEVNFVITTDDLLD